MTTPYLRFDFKDSNGHHVPLEFSKPLQVLTAESLKEVRDIFGKVEQALADGYTAAGFVSYEAAPAFRPELNVRDPDGFPLVWFGLFRGPTSADSPFGIDGLYRVSDWRMTSSELDYADAVDRIKQAIQDGTTYQVNFTERLHARFEGDDRAFYVQLLRNQQADYSAYINTGRHRILSVSPELFFRVDNGRITAKPMKGTAPRGRSTAEDARNAARLLASPKERAENLMIVDLLRNDLSRIARSGTVHVSKLFETETYPTVHQLTSTIEAELRPDLSVFDWFKALFPCGSITGAPKVSTMGHIAELEQTPRNVYCGAIGYITPDKHAVFNVPIRTVQIDSVNGQAIYGVGGGITWDSTSAGEYAELAAKARLLTERRPVFQLLESLRLEQGRYPYMAGHLDRLKDSARYFRFKFDAAQVSAQLQETARQFSEGIYKVRLLLDEQGGCHIETVPLMELATPVKGVLAHAPVDSSDPFLYHKTTNRKVYEERAAEHPGIFAVLLQNERQELTEFTIGNLIIERQGRFLTPPLSTGLLPGVLRQQLLESNKIKEQILHAADLQTADRIWMINSVRGWLPVELHFSEEGD